MTPGDSLFHPDTESVLVAASLAQARIVYRVARSYLEPLGGYRFADSASAVGIVHKATNTRLRAIASRGKTAMGIINCPLAIMDEPGALEARGGQLLADALITALGKVDSPMRAVFIGTLAPASSGWWHDLVAGGSRGGTYVQLLQGDLDTWDSWHTIRKCNPLVEVSAMFRRKLLEERDAARSDPRLKARFLSYRLNIPSQDESQTLLTTDDWKRTTARDVPEREGRPIVGLDLGGGRAWSAAVALYRNGRCEALALAPGAVDLATQEKRDTVPAGAYQKLVDGDALRLATGLHVPPVSMLLDFIRERWGTPDCIVCDRFRLGELQDAAGRVPLISRVARYSEQSEDIRALRKMAKDGPLSVAPDSRALLVASLAVAEVKNDDAGNMKMVKRGSNNTARDDVAAGLVLAAGALERAPSGPSFIYHGKT